MTIPLDGSSSTLPLPAPVVPDETTYGSFCEFPSVNPRYKGAAYRYVYCLSATRPTNMGNSLSKIDVETGATATWHEPGAAPGERMRVLCHAVALLQAFCSVATCFCLAAMRVSRGSFLTRFLAKFEFAGWLSQLHASRYVLLASVCLYAT